MHGKYNNMEDLWIDAKWNDLVSGSNACIQLIVQRSAGCLKICYAQVTHSRIISPVLLRIKLTDDPGNANFRSLIQMHNMRMIKDYYVWLRMQYGKLQTNTDCHQWCRIESMANQASSPWMCDLGITGIISPRLSILCLKWSQVLISKLWCDMIWCFNISEDCFDFKKLYRPCWNTKLSRILSWSLLLAKVCIPV